MKTGEEKTGQLQKNKNVRVKLGNRNFEYAKLPDGSEVFLEKLAEGSLNLWANHTSKFREAKKNESSYGSDKPAAFMSSIEYYTGTPGSLSALKLRKKDVLDLMSEHSKEIKDYVKKARTKFNNQDDVVALFRHYNNL